MLLIIKRFFPSARASRKYYLVLQLRGIVGGESDRHEEPPMTKEADIQIACNDYLNYLAKRYSFRHFHVPNEGKRSIYLHAKMKKMGLKSGCPDIIVEYPQGKLLYIELKAPKGRLSPNQKLWAVQSKVLETPHFVVQGEIEECIEQVRRIVEKYIPLQC